MPPTPIPPDVPGAPAALTARPAALTTHTAALTAALNGGPTLSLGQAAAAGLPSVSGAALLVATSGSSAGRPSIVALAASTVRHAVAATHDRLGGPGAWLLTVPADHIAGVMVCARALLSDAPVVASEGSFRPETFVADVQRLAAAADSGSRRYTSLVPTQLHRVLADPAALEAARTFDAILVGGAATSPALLLAARAAGIRVVTTYGMTETAGGCVYDGVALAGTSVDLDGDGRITLRGDQVALGYVTPEGLEPFNGRIITADRGRWTHGAAGDDGAARLEILGRLDDVIVTGGVNVEAHEVERIIGGLDGVAEVAVIGVPDAEWGAVVAVALVLSPGATPDAVASAAQQLVRDALGSPAVPRRFLVLPELPLRGPGKIDRRELVRRLGGS